MENQRIENMQEASQQATATAQEGSFFWGEDEAAASVADVETIEMPDELIRLAGADAADGHIEMPDDPVREQAGAPTTQEGSPFWGEDEAAASSADDHIEMPDEYARDPAAPGGRGDLDLEPDPGFNFEDLGIRPEVLLDPEPEIQSPTPTDWDYTPHPDGTSIFEVPPEHQESPKVDVDWDQIEPGEGVVDPPTVETDPVPQNHPAAPGGRGDLDLEPDPGFNNEDFGIPSNGLPDPAFDFEDPLPDVVDVLPEVVVGIGVGLSTVAGAVAEGTGIAVEAVEEAERILGPLKHWWESPNDPWDHEPTTPTQKPLPDDWEGEPTEPNHTPHPDDTSITEVPEPKVDVETDPLPENHPAAPDGRGDLDLEPDSELNFEDFGMPSNGLPYPADEIGEVVFDIGEGVLDVGQGMFYVGEEVLDIGSTVLGEVMEEIDIFSSPEAW